MDSVDQDWENFIENDNIDLNMPLHNNTTNTSSNIESPKKIINNTNSFIPKCSDIYISTQTKIAHLNETIDLNDTFWKLPMIKYHEHKEGILKIQMKVNSLNKEEIVELEKKINDCDNLISVDKIHCIDNPDARKIKFKDVRKINIGLCKKDLISYRTKKKGAFYNCFVLILRLKDDTNIFKEYHVKIFNTGKLELPGIKNNKALYKVLNKVIEILSPFVNEKLIYAPSEIKTVLINSNFSCNYFIDREKLSRFIKFNHNLHVLYDPCSYPGIQCKFYYNEKNTNNIGICQCGEKCYNKKNKNVTRTCSEISFMIFRTGSILIVGKCSEYILNKVYTFIKTILIDNYPDFIIKEQTGSKKEKKKKVWKKNIIVTK